MIPGLLISLWASAKVKSTFAKYQHVPTISGLTGAQATRRILDGNGLQAVRIERVAGNLSDHYDPKANVVRLSAGTYNSPSVGAVGVAAHECGHAVQHAEGYAPARLRSAIVPICNVGSGLSVPLIVIGFIFNMLQLVYVGIAFFSLAVLFQLVTLPVEFNASKRAILTLDSTGMVTPEESAGVRKVLSAAALTYVAALLTSLLQLLYYITIAGRRRN
ncbi:MAG: zinc metallopeptidase [Oscillospiraceae bacterium]